MIKTHDPLCLEGLTDEERDNVVSAIEPERCDFCILIAKVRADERIQAGIRVGALTQMYPEGEGGVFIDRYNAINTAEGGDVQ